jgi:hypothetical protein
LITLRDNLITLRDNFSFESKSHDGSVNKVAGYKVPLIQVWHVGVLSFSSTLRTTVTAVKTRPV